MQCRIINRVESSENYFSRMQSRACPDGFNAGFHSPLTSTPSADHLAYDSITSSAMLLADNLKAKGMIVFTETGTGPRPAKALSPLHDVITVLCCRSCHHANVRSAHKCICLLCGGKLYYPAVMTRKLLLQGAQLSEQHVFGQLFP